MIVNSHIPYLSNSGIEIRDVHSIFQLSKFDDKDYFCVDFLMGKNLINLPSAIPHDILVKIQNKTIHLMLLNSHESFHHVVDGIYDYAVLGLQIPEEQVHLFSESADIRDEIKLVASKLGKKEINAVWVRMFEYSVQQTVLHNNDYKNPITLENKEYSKKFLNFNRRWRPHRPTSVAFLELNNLLSQGYVSLAHSDDNNSWDTVWENIVGHYMKDPGKLDLLISNKQRIFNIPPLYLDRKDLEVNHVTLLPSTNWYYQNTYFSVVSETNYYDYLDIGRFLSEKVFKPIAHQHPFIILSRPGCLKALKSIGYKTFDGIINESYDDEQDDITRMDMIVDEVRRLCNLNETDLHNFLVTAKEICVYNYNVLLNKSKFITEL